MSGHVLTFGETMALVRADAGAWETSSSATVGIGGADSNVAIGLSRLGVPTSWIGRVGDDPLGRRVVRELRAEAIDVHAPLGPGRTGLMVKDKRTPHTTRVVFYRTDSAGSTLSPEDIPVHLVIDARLVHVTGITASLSPSANDTVEKVLALAREHEVPVSFDVNHRPSLWSEGDAGALYRRIAAQSDIVFAGDDEARLLVGPTGGTVGEAPADLARAISDLGPREVLIKRGADGAVGLVDGEIFDQPAVVVPVVDTVGAGDGFVAGYLAARLDGRPPAERLRQAVEVGAFACLDAGDWEGLPRTADLALLRSREPVTR